MNVKEVKPKGIFQSFKKSSFEVTAATEEKEKHVDSGMALKNLQKMHETINVAAIYTASNQSFIQHFYKSQIFVFFGIGLGKFFFLRFLPRA